MSDLPVKKIYSRKYSTFTGKNWQIDKRKDRQLSSKNGDICKGKCLNKSHAV